MGNEASVRVWPWMCVARAGTLAMPGVKGFVWRDALAGAGELKGGEELRSPLLVVERGGKGAVVAPSLRMVWLSAGLNDAGLLGLLEKRSDAAMVNEVLAGLVGRTGLRDELPRPGGDWPLAPTGYLYAGWPSERGLWNQVTPMLERLVLAHDPGEAVKMRQDDPLYLAAKVWLAQARRPVARIGGYDFSMRSGRGSDIVDARVSVLAENPVADRAEFDLRFASLPGDFDMAPEAGGEGAAGGGLRRRSVTMAPSALGRIDLPLAGHVDALVQAPGLERLELTERHGGMNLRVPVRLPVYRTHATEQWGTGSPRADGTGADWPMDPQLKVFGEMTAGLRYASRPDLLTATVREDGAPATVRWAYDENFLYMLARCPQEAVSDDRNTEWPVTAPVGGGRGRWWGSDGLQVQVADVGESWKPEAGTPRPDGRRVVQIAFKPAGVALVRTGVTSRRAGGAVAVEWREGAPTAGGGAAGIRYGITVEKKEGRTTGYVVEAAIPRAWVAGKVPGVNVPAWRVNVLRHRAGDLASMSWSGPVVDDEDVGMKGLVVGE
jgi:hypothetical protein